MDVATLAPPHQAHLAPLEWWEAVRDRHQQWWQRHETLARRRRTAQVAVMWAALPAITAAWVFVPSFRGSIHAYLGSFVLVAVWFVLSRTKTLSWAVVARLFAVCVGWSAIIGWFTLRFADQLGLWSASAGSSTALAGFLEESGKLIPLVALVVLTPGRVRRMSATDWGLVGFASGAAFTAYEDAVRAVVAPRSLWGFFYDPMVYSLNPWTSGVFSDRDATAPGHHIWTATIAMSVGLAVVLWRRRTLLARVIAVAGPAGVLFLAITEHVSFNAYTGDSMALTAGGIEGYPWVMGALWRVTGMGTGTTVLSVVLLVGCLLVDAHRRHQAAQTAAFTDLYASMPLAAPTWHLPTATGRWSALTEALTVVAHAGAPAAGQWWTDVIFAAAAHTRTPGETVRTAISRGRTTATGVRLLRAHAMTVTTPGLEPAARRRFALTAALLGAVGLLVCLGWGGHIASTIGHGLSTSGDSVYLAGLLDGLGRWWSDLSPAQQILIGAGVAFLVVASGGSFGLALGVSGAATYVASHASGAAAFVRDPAAATRSYVTTTTPGEAALDVGEAVLTFLPGNFAGAAAGSLGRRAIREYAQDPALFWAARDVALTGDSGVVDFGAFLRREPIQLTDGTTLRAATPDVQTAADAVVDGLPPGPLKAYGDPGTYQVSVYGPVERLVTAPDGTVLSVDGFSTSYGLVAGDAKFVASRSSSIYIPESIRGSFSQVATRRMDEVLVKLAEAAEAVGGIPVEIVTNDLQSAHAWEARMRALDIVGYARIEP